MCFEIFAYESVYVPGRRVERNRFVFPPVVWFTILVITSLRFVSAGASVRVALRYTVGLFDTRSIEKMFWFRICIFDFIVRIFRCLFRLVP